MACAMKFAIVLFTLWRQCDEITAVPTAICLDTKDNPGVFNLTRKLLPLEGEDFVLDICMKSLTDNLGESCHKITGGLIATDVLQERPMYKAYKQDSFLWEEFQAFDDDLGRALIGQVKAFTDSPTGLPTTAADPMHTTDQRSSTQTLTNTSDSATDAKRIIEPKYHDLIFYITLILALVVLAYQGFQIALPHCYNGIAALDCPSGCILSSPKGKVKLTSGGRLHKLDCDKPESKCLCSESSLVMAFSIYLQERLGLKTASYSKTLTFSGTIYKSMIFSYFVVTGVRGESLLGDAELPTLEIANIALCSLIFFATIFFCFVRSRASFAIMFGLLTCASLINGLLGAALNNWPAFEISVTGISSGIQLIFFIFLMVGSIDFAIKQRRSRQTIEPEISERIKRKRLPLASNKSKPNIFFIGFLILTLLSLFICPGLTEVLTCSSRTHGREIDQKGELWEDRFEINDLFVRLDKLDKTFEKLAGVGLPFFEQGQYCTDRLASSPNGDLYLAGRKLDLKHMNLEKGDFTIQPESFNYSGNSCFAPNFTQTVKQVILKSAGISMRAEDFALAYELYQFNNVFQWTKLIGVWSYYSHTAKYCSTCVSKDDFNKWKNNVQNSITYLTNSVVSLFKDANDSAHAMAELVVSLETVINKVDTMTGELKEMVGTVSSIELSNAFRAIFRARVGSARTLYEQTYKLIQNILEDALSFGRPKLSNSYFQNYLTHRSRLLIGKTIDPDSLMLSMHKGRISLFYRVKNPKPVIFKRGIDLAYCISNNGNSITFYDSFELLDVGNGRAGCNSQDSAQFKASNNGFITGKAPIQSFNSNHTWILDKAHERCAVKLGSLTHGFIHLATHTLAVCMTPCTLFHAGRGQISNQTLTDISSKLPIAMFIEGLQVAQITEQSKNRLDSLLSGPLQDIEIHDNFILNFQDKNISLDTTHLEGVVHGIILRNKDIAQSINISKQFLAAAKNVTFDSEPSTPNLFDTISRIAEGVVSGAEGLVSGVAKTLLSSTGLTLLPYILSGLALACSILVPIIISKLDRQRQAGGASKLFQQWRKFQTNDCDPEYIQLFWAVSQVFPSPVDQEEVIAILEVTVLSLLARTVILLCMARKDYKISVKDFLDTLTKRGWFGGPIEKSQELKVASWFAKRDWEYVKSCAVNPFKRWYRGATPLPPKTHTRFALEYLSVHGYMGGNAPGDPWLGFPECPYDFFISSSEITAVSSEGLEQTFSEGIKLSQILKFNDNGDMKLENEDAVLRATASVAALDAMAKTFDSLKKTILDPNHVPSADYPLSTAVASTRDFVQRLMGGTAKSESSPAEKLSKKREQYELEAEENVSITEAMRKGWEDFKTTLQDPMHEPPPEHPLSKIVVNVREKITGISSARTTQENDWVQMGPVEAEDYLKGHSQSTQDLSGINSDGAISQEAAQILSEMNEDLLTEPIIKSKDDELNRIANFLLE